MCCDSRTWMLLYAKRIISNSVRKAQIWKVISLALYLCVRGSLIGLNPEVLTAWLTKLRVQNFASFCNMTFRMHRWLSWSVMYWFASNHVAVQHLAIGHCQFLQELVYVLAGPFSWLLGSLGNLGYCRQNGRPLEKLLEKMDKLKGSLRKSTEVWAFWAGDGSKPWYLVNPKIAGKWMFIPLKWY